MIDQKTYDVVAIGTKYSYSPGFSVRSVVIQNPSGMWLYVPQARQYVPPQSLGAILTLDPPALLIDIQLVAAPTGGIVSAVTGGPIVVFYSDIENVPYQGLDYGLDNNLATLNASIQQLDTDIKNLTGGFGSNATGWNRAFANITINAAFTNIILAPGIGKQLIIMGCVATWVSPNRTLRGEVLVQFAENGGAMAWQTNLTPERPTDGLLFPPKAITITANTAFTVVAGTVNAAVGGGEAVNALVYYYVQ